MMGALHYIMTSLETTETLNIGCQSWVGRDWRIMTLGIRSTHRRFNHDGSGLGRGVLEEGVSSFQPLKSYG